MLDTPPPMLFPQCILELPRSPCVGGDYTQQRQVLAPHFLDFHVKVRTGANFLWIFLWPSIRPWPPDWASLGTGFDHSTHGPRGPKEGVCGKLTPSLWKFPPLLPFLSCCWGRVGDICSDFLHTLSSSDSPQCWCPSNPNQHTVGALPQLPRPVQMYLVQPQNDTKIH